MKRLLVVDDSRAIRAFMEARLNAYFDLSFASDGQAGLEKALLEPLDLVLSDINMPHLNGFQLHRALKEVQPELPVVLMTDADIDTYLRDALDGEVSDIIAKASFRSDPDGTIRVLNRLFRPQRFGMERLLGPHGEVRTFIASSAQEVPAILEQCNAILHRFPRRDTYQRILPELVHNAFMHGNRNEGHDDKLVYITVGADWQRVGLGVRDCGGRMGRRTVLEHFMRLLEQKHEIRPRGQGLLLVRWMMDQSFITMEPGVQTEVMCFDLIEGHFGHRSLHVTELEDPHAHRRALLEDPLTHPVLPPLARL